MPVKRTVKAVSGRVIGREMARRDVVDVQRVAIKYLKKKKAEKTQDRSRSETVLEAVIVR